MPVSRRTNCNARYHFELNLENSAKSISVPPPADEYFVVKQPTSAVGNLALLSEREMLQAERDVVVAERDTVVAEWDMAVAQAANAQAMWSDSEALIASLGLAIEKLKRELRGRRSERTARLMTRWNCSSKNW